MPLYEYQCDACGSRFEVIQKYSDAPVAACTSCGGAVKKLMSSPAIQFKGSGWYITDYARKGSTGAGSPSSSGESATSASTGATSGETKAGETKAGESKPSESKSSDSSSKSDKQ
jgi:putative FmdB family regulatory protein